MIPASLSSPSKARPDPRHYHSAVRITPTAFRDGPLLNAAGIHKPWALRSIVEVETSDGRVGISETYGDEPRMLRVLDQARDLIVDLSPFDLYPMEERVREAIRPVAGAVEFELAPGSHSAKIQSIKLKGDVFEPAHEIACMQALAQAFPGTPLRLDPNANWSLEISINAAPQLDEVLEYYEDPCPGLEGMAELAKHTKLPLATNLVITTLDEFHRGVGRESAKVILSDHHYWGGLRVTQTLARMCRLWELGMSMHSNSHLGISPGPSHEAAAEDRAIGTSFEATDEQDRWRLGTRRRSGAFCKPSTSWKIRGRGRVRTGSTNCCWWRCAPSRAGPRAG